MNTLPRENIFKDFHPSRLAAAWQVLSLMLFFGLGSSSSLQAGCFPGENYRDFHHGSFFQPERTTLTERVPSLPKALSSDAWIYEDGTFHPLQNPLPPRCDGPGCRSNPLESQWGVTHSSPDTIRSLPVGGSETIFVDQLPKTYAYWLGRNESPHSENWLAVERPPKFS